MKSEIFSYTSDCQILGKEASRSYRSYLHYRIRHPSRDFFFFGISSKYKNSYKLYIRFGQKAAGNARG